MPFNVGQAVEDSTQWFLKANVVRNIAKSSIATAVVITIIIMLMVAFVYGDIESEEGRHVLALRSGFWSFIIILVLLHLHQKILETPISAGGDAAGPFAPVVIKSLID